LSPRLGDERSGLWIIVMVETRAAPRFRVAKPAKIEDGGFMVGCIIRDLSLSGAAVEITDIDTKFIPATFTLIVPEDGLKLSCRLVWRGAFRVGVTFT
jgi:PilZ domain-containing protein